MVLSGPTTRASEGQHWYDRDGTPRYEVLRADGKGMRPATLRDARKHGWYPGVTSIIKCAAAPGLERWKQDQSVLSALTLPRRGDEAHDVLLGAIRNDAEEQARKARDWGTRFHAAIQGHYEGATPDADLLPWVECVVASIDANFPGREWTPEKPCAHPLGFGTKADLSCADALIDFKGSDFDETKAPKLETWDEHHMQLGATREALKRPQSEGAICYVSRQKPICRIIRVDDGDLCRGWEMFRNLHGYWCAKANYYPALWAPEKEAA